MSLLDHARAARILGEVWTEVSASQTDGNLCLMAGMMASGFIRAADRMEAEIKHDASTYLDTSGCTLRHSLKTPKCPACGSAHG